ncbi:hypothetical protein AGMMS49949_03580 [Alphaproteobacteria bacterium]|nr:hypothetical protein AGMMS49949_03580 [Alphaproteobacteria bacterium]GHS96429.1 hypothetical protein AGMMS50296_2570 [Alphaproteobacteria bacterium]
MCRIQKKILEFFGRDGNTFKRTAKTFNISTSTIGCWKREFSKTGIFQKKPVQRKFRKIDLEKLSAMLVEKPDMFQRERTEVFGVARRFPQNALKKLNFSRKKVKNYLERNEEKRRESEKQMKSIPKENIVHVDKSGINEHLHREYGYSKIGGKIQGKIPGKKFERINIIELFGIMQVFIEARK